MTRWSSFTARFLAACLLFPFVVFGDEPETVPSYSRDVMAIFSRLGCNGGTCHGAVQGKNGFRLSLFAAKPEHDYEQVVFGSRGRRVSLAAPNSSLLLRKPLGEVPHGGGVLLDRQSPEYLILRNWIREGAPLDSVDAAKLNKLTVNPAQRSCKPGQTYSLRVMATFADGSSRIITNLCSFETLDKHVATIDRMGQVTATGVGDTAVIVRYRGEPVMTMVEVPQKIDSPVPALASTNFIDEHINRKLRRLNLPPSGMCDDATFLRRVTLDIAGRLPTSEEVRVFSSDTDSQKRLDRIDQLLASDGHIGLWTMRFCDLLKASDFGVYADAVDTKTDAPRFQAWVQERLRENTPYDELVERILLATSREGRSLSDWQSEVHGLFEGYRAGRSDLDLYKRRRTLDLYWMRKNATGVTGALQVAHSFLGLRLECAQCHRHPHDVWQQDDLLSFANFFMRVRGSGFNGQNEKIYPDVAKAYASLKDEAKKRAEQAKKLGAEANKLKQEIKTLERKQSQIAGELNKQKDLGKGDLSRLEGEQKIIGQQIQSKQQRVDEISEMARQGKYLVEVGRRMMHAEVMHLGQQAKDKFASVTSPLGTQQSRTFRLLGESADSSIAEDTDPRLELVAWMKRPDNPFVARAIVNRVWAHYFGRGIIDPPDNLSPFNPPTHPKLLEELARQFVQSGYDLRWLHRTIVQSQTYQRSSTPTKSNRVDRSNYAYFYLRRLDAEVLLDAIDDVTAQPEDFRMKYYHWKPGMRHIEVPYRPEQNEFVSFMLEQFGRPSRNSAIQCDCERVRDVSILQSLSLANHPRVWAKIKSDTGRAAKITSDITNDQQRVEEVFLVVVGRMPTSGEREAAETFIQQSESVRGGVEGLMWSLLNTKEFLLQH